MARIQTYNIDTVLSDADKMIGTDADDANKTVNFTIGDLKTYINAAVTDVIPECFIGKNSETLDFTGVENLQTIVFTAANNANNTSSYHLGTAPAVLQNTAGVIQNMSGSQIIVKVEFSCAVSFSGGISEVIYYLQKSVNSGVTWTNEDIVTRDHRGGQASIAQHSFWFIELLNSGDQLRVQMAGRSGEQLSALSAVSFAVKAPGNII